MSILNLQRGLCVGAGLFAMVMPVTGSAQLEEILVTARKRTENLQQVPLSVNTISAEDIERLNIVTAEEVARLDPSVQFDYGYTQTDTRIVIRGLSPTRGRVNAAVLIDGIDVTSESIQFAGGSMLATTRLLDVERVEIIKGPQSALYGRSAFAGAIQYITKDPSEELSGSLKLGFGDEGRYDLSGAISGMASETLGLRLYGNYWNEDGFYQEQATGSDVGGGNGFGLALTAKWTPTDTFSAKARLSFSDDEYDQRATAYARTNTSATPDASLFCLRPAFPAQPAPGCVFAVGPDAMGAPDTSSQTRFFYAGATPRADQLAVNLSPNIRTGGVYPGGERDLTRFGLELNWELGQGTLKSWTGVADATFKFLTDGDFDAQLDAAGNDIAGRASEFNISNDTTQFSQELRYESNFDGPVNFAVGAQYWNEDAEQTDFNINILCFPAFFNCVNFANFQTIPASQILGGVAAERSFNAREVDHTSVYGVIDFQLGDAWKLSLSGRFSDEEETVVGTVCSSALDFDWSATFMLPPGSFVQACQDPSLTPTGAPPGVPTFPFAVFGPSVPFLFNPTAQAPVSTQSLVSSDDFSTGRISLQWQANPNLMAYGSIATAVKPGGTSTVTAGTWFDGGDFDGSPDEFTYLQEKLTAVEVGMKLDWLDGRMRTNAALFYQDYSDKQTGSQIITQSGIAVGRIINAGEAELTGLELLGQWLPTDNWLLSVAYTYIDAEYTDFRFQSTSATDMIRGGGCARVVQPAVQFAPGQFTGGVCEINIGGNKMEDVPEHAVVFQGRYSAPVAFGDKGEWYAEWDAGWQDERFIDTFNRRIVESNTLVNLRFGLKTEAWEAMVYVNNATDSDKPTSATDAPGDVDAAIVAPNSFSPTDGITVALPRPRHYGVQFNYRFGE